MSGRPQSTPAWFTAFAALAVVVGSQVLRVMITMDAWFLRDRVGTLGVIPYALAPFALAVLAAPLARRGLLRPAIAAATAVLVAGRLAEQVTHDSAVDVWVAGIGGTAFLVLLPLLAAVDLRRFGIGFLLGIALDTGLKGALRTLDLSWMEGLLPFAGAAVLAGALAVAGSALLRGPLEPSGTNGRSTWGLVALGPLLFLLWQVLASPGWISTQTGWPPEASLALVLAGLAVAISAAARTPSPPVTGAAVLVLVLVPAVGRWTSPWFGLLALAGLVAAGIAVGSVTAAPTPGRGAATAAAVGAGNVLMVLALFAFYLTLELDLPFRQPAVLAAAGVVVGLLVLAGGAPATAGTRARTAIALAAGLLVVPALLWATRVDPPQAPDTLTVMTYNIAQGIAVGGQLDPEGVARVVEESGATLVGFQEISRSYLLSAGTDLTWWLSHRLGLPFDYGWAEDGGNATLTAFPITSSALADLPLLGTPQRRTVLDTGIVGPTGSLTVLNTHLTNRVTAGIPDEEKEADYATVQIPQLDAVLATWDGRDRTVLVGDFNMRPAWRQYRYLVDRGFEDGWDAGTGPGYTTTDDRVGWRIDYVFHTPDLEPTAAAVIDTGASLDHLPVVVTFEGP